MNKLSQDDRVPVKRFNVDTGIACNFTCDNCSHFSNYKHNHLVSFEELKGWYDLWQKKISPKKITILGGEPLLNKRIYDILYLTREVWDDPYLRKIQLSTNGSLLSKHPQLPKVLKDTNIHLEISKHGNDVAYNIFWKKVLDTVSDWVEKYDIKVKIVKSDEQWVQIYQGRGFDIEPFEDKNPEESWNNCPTGQDCFQMADGNIYKCAPLAHLPTMNKKYNLSEKWDPYLKYTPLKPDCSREEIIEFFSRESEKYCGMCPSKPRRMLRDNMINLVDIL